MNYNLSKGASGKQNTLSALGNLLLLISSEKKNLYLALAAIFINSAISLSGPVLIGHTIDSYVQTKQYNGVLLISGILLIMYTFGFGVSYLQTKLMGGVG